MTLNPTRQAALRSLIGCIQSQRTVDIDWFGVIALANETLTTSVLAHKLASKRCPEVPFQVQRFLQEVLARNTQRNMKARQQLVELLDALNTIGIFPVLLKGTSALISDHELSTRLISDLDLLVVESEFPRAVQCLYDLGYEFLNAVPTMAASFGRPNDVGPIDLHAKIAGLGKNQHVIWDKRVPVDIEAVKAYLPSPSCQLIVLIVHDQLHDADYWRGLIDLRHMIDMHNLISHSEIDWEFVEELLSGPPIQNAFRTQMKTLSELFSIQVPQRIVSNFACRFQFWRRMIQLDHSSLGVLFLVLTLVLEFPSVFFKGSSPPSSSLVGTIRSRLRVKGIRRLWAAKALGKV